MSRYGSAGRWWVGSLVALCLLGGSCGTARSAAAPSVLRTAQTAEAAGTEEESGLVLVADNVLDVKIIEGSEERKGQIEQCIRGSIWEFDGKDRFFYSSCDTLPNARPVKGGYQDDGSKLVFLTEPGAEPQMKVVGVLTVRNHHPVIVQRVEITPEASAGEKPLVFEFVVTLRAGSSDSRVATLVTA